MEASHKPITIIFLDRQFERLPEIYVYIQLLIWKMEVNMNSAELQCLKKKDKPLIVITLKIVLPGFFLVCQTIMHDAKLI